MWLVDNQLACVLRLCFSFVFSFYAQAQLKKLAADAERAAAERDAAVAERAGLQAQLEGQQTRLAASKKETEDARARLEVLTVGVLRNTTR